MASIFTSLEAHNGCHALFNNVKGWAYICPAGEIDPNAYPRTVSFSFNSRRAGPEAASAAAGAADAAAHRASVRSGLPGDGAPRKTNEILGAYLDGADLIQLLEEGSHFGPPGRGLPVASAESVDDPLRPRKGSPIVLSLQAILSGKPAASTASPQPSATVDVVNDNGEAEGPPQVSDHTHFPRLRSPELFLAPPTVMKGWAAGASGGLSCSEAVTEASAAVVGKCGTGGTGEEGAGVSRVGWWLRWAIAGSGNADAVADIDGGTESTTVEALFEMRGGLDGWQVVSNGTQANGRGDSSAASPILANASGDGDDSDGESSWCDVNVADMIVDNDDRLSSARDDGRHQSQYVPCNMLPGGSYRDVLMTPNSAGCVEFSNFGASSARRVGVCKAYTTVPRLVEGSWTTFWKSAAAGKTGKILDDDFSEDEDPYYARKRIGAFAFRTKPRGKSHK